MTERIPPSRTSPTIDPRDTKPYRDLISAHALLERVKICLEQPTGGMHRDFSAAARDQGIPLTTMLARELEIAMHRIADHIPCKYEGVPQYLCGCPDCTPEPDEGDAP
jgi:hypothetical protein